MTEKAKRNYPFRGKIYTAEQIDNIISGLSFDGYTKEETDELLDLKQDVLTAGTGISIENDTISATGYTKSETDALLDDKQNVLTAGVGIDITNDTISAFGETYTLFDKTDWSELFDISTDHGYSTNRFIALKNIIIIVFDNAASMIPTIFIPKNIPGKYSVYRGNGVGGSSFHAVTCPEINIATKLTSTYINLVMQYLTVTQVGNTNDGTFSIYYDNNDNSNYSKQIAPNNGRGIYLYVGD